MQYNEETLHGTHYTASQFDEELERRVQAQIDNEGDDFDYDDLDSWRRHYLRELYLEWNAEADTDQFLRFEMANSMTFYQQATAGYTKEDSDNPLLEPIHGVSLKDYVAIVINLNNFEPEVLFGAFGIDSAVWDEVNVLWPKRMQEDPTFTVTTLYGQYFTEVASHPAILSLQGGGGAVQNENLERLETDRYFYEELNGARNAAYEYGIDGAQWIEDNYGISLVDFQRVATNWMTAQNEQFSSDEILHFLDYQQEKYEAYKAKFAEERGGNIADDVAF